jgi:hypothetical protein
MKMNDEELKRYRDNLTVSISFYSDHAQYERHHHTVESFCFKRKECMKVLHLTKEEHEVLAIKTREEFEK